MKLLYIIKSHIHKDVKHFISELNEHISDIKVHFLDDNESNVISVYNEYKPDIVLIHYNRFCFDKNFYNHINKSYNIYWRNDERFPLEKWYEYLTSINLFLTSSEDSANEVKKMGKDARYLIMGFNPCDKIEQERKYDIVFTGQNSNNIFPLSSKRRDMIFALKEKFDNFYCYGSGWGKEDTHIPSSIYNESKIGIAVNHYDTNKTYSNRMYQIINNKALCIAYETKGLRDVFGDNIVYFTTFDELTEKIEYYLKENDKRNEIVQRAREFIINNHTWKHKAKTIIEIMKQKKVING